MNHWIPNSERRCPDISAKWATHVICPLRCKQGTSAREGSSSGSFNLPSLSIGFTFLRFHRQQRALRLGTVPVKSGLVAGGISVNEAEEAYAYFTALFVNGSVA